MGTPIGAIIRNTIITVCIICNNAIRRVSSFSLRPCAVVSNVISRSLFTKGIARVCRGYHPAAREPPAPSLDLPSEPAIDGDNYTAMFARLRTVSISRGGPRVHSTYRRLNPLRARRNAAVEFSINNVTGKLRRKTGAAAQQLRPSFSSFNFYTAAKSYLCPPETSGSLRARDSCKRRPDMSLKRRDQFCILN